MNQRHKPKLTLVKEDGYTRVHQIPEEKIESISDFSSSSTPSKRGRDEIESIHSSTPDRDHSDKYKENHTPNTPNTDPQPKKRPLRFSLQSCTVPPKRNISSKFTEKPAPAEADSEAGVFTGLFNSDWALELESRSENRAQLQHEPEPEVVLIDNPAGPIESVYPLQNNNSRSILGSLLKDTHSHVHFWDPVNKQFCEQPVNASCYVKRFDEVDMTNEQTKLSSITTTYDHNNPGKTAGTKRADFITKAQNQPLATIVKHITISDMKEAKKIKDAFIDIRDMKTKITAPIAHGYTYTVVIELKGERRNREELVANLESCVAKMNLDGITIPFVRLMYKTPIAWVLTQPFVPEAKVQHQVFAQMFFQNQTKQGFSDRFELINEVSRCWKCLNTRPNTIKDVTALLGALDDQCRGLAQDIKAWLVSKAQAKDEFKTLFDSNQAITDDWIQQNISAQTDGDFAELLSHVEQQQDSIQTQLKELTLNHPVEVPGLR